MATTFRGSSVVSQMRISVSEAKRTPSDTNAGKGVFLDSLGRVPAELVESPTLCQMWRLNADVTTGIGASFFGTGIEACETSPQTQYGIKTATPPTSSAAATANITGILDTSGIPAALHGETITLIDAAGSPVTKTYKFMNSSTSNGAIDGGDSTIHIAIQGETTKEGLVDNIEQAVEHANGHNGSISVSRSGAALTLTQGTAGTAGNTTITFSSGISTTTEISKTNFTGGTDMGTFNFPQTGIYLVTCNAMVQRASADAERVGVNIFGTANYTTAPAVFTQLADAYCSLKTDVHANHRQMIQCMTLFDCVNTDTHKVRFRHDSSAAATIMGNTDVNETTFTFLRVGDT
tara:strand:+ start:398 stop:1444 length:1047 start_codon:yes stop_codon:yes gene_type:complete